jgi:hypothetical protein
MEKAFKDYAVKAFNEGSDNFGETVLGTVGVLTYNKTIKGYLMDVHLMEDGRLCNSGVGFYPYDDILRVRSGKYLDWVVEITPEIREEMNNAVIEEF